MQSLRPGGCHPVCGVRFWVGGGGWVLASSTAYFYYTSSISCSENSRVYRRCILLILRRQWTSGGGGQSWGACVVGAGWVFRRRCPFPKCRRVSHTGSGIESHKSHWFWLSFVIFNSNLGALFLSKLTYLRGFRVRERSLMYTPTKVDVYINP